MANYATIENNLITGVYDFLPENWKNISNFYALKNESEYLRSLGWREVVKIQPLYNPDTQRLGNPIFTVENDEVIETTEIIDLPKPQETTQLTEAEILSQTQALHILAMDQLRTKRDKLLSNTDYTQLADVMSINGPELTTQFQTYRQLLRDLPALYENDLTFVSERDAVFPTVPTPPEVNEPVPVTDPATDTNGVI